MKRCAWPPARTTSSCSCRPTAGRARRWRTWRRRRRGARGSRRPRPPEMRSPLSVDSRDGGRIAEDVGSGPCRWGGGSTRGCKGDVDGGGGGGVLFFGTKNTGYIQSTYVCKYNRTGIACSRYRREEIQTPLLSLSSPPPKTANNRTQRPAQPTSII